MTAPTPPPRIGRFAGGAAPTKRQAGKKAPKPARQLPPARPLGLGLINR